MGWEGSRTENKTPQNIFGFWTCIVASPKNALHPFWMGCNPHP